MAEKSYHREKHGMLSVESRIPGSKYLCRCDCGESRVVSVGHFNTGKIKSCGCHVVRHGHGGGVSGGPSRAYICYHNMIARCHKKSNKRYGDYGGKGIFVCKRWQDSFVNFLEDMGDMPDHMTIDRIDNSKGYCKENCRWATREQNQRNRDCAKIWTLHGQEFVTLAQAAKHYGVSSAAILAWCKGRKAAGRWYPPKPGCSVRGVADD